VLPRFKMRVWEAEEDLRELRFPEEVGQEFHAVCAETGEILVLAASYFCRRSSCRSGGGLVAKGFYFFLDKFGHGYADFHA